MMTAERKELIFEILFGGILGAVIFLSACGPDIVNIYNTDWIMCLDHCMDTKQHFLGGMLYINDAWHWPPFLLANSSYDMMNLLSVDGIPVMGLFFKIIYPLFFKGHMIQYLGLWGLLSMILQGVMGALLMHRVVSGAAGRLIGIVMLILSAPLWWRFPEHTSLCSHWLILWGLWLWLQPMNRKYAIQWGLLMCLSMMIHPYITAMLLVLWGGRILQMVKERAGRNDIICGVACVAGGMLAVVYLLGYFHCSFASDIWKAYGSYGLNLNALFNPVMAENSLLVKPLPYLKLHEELWMYESLMYLGAGLLLLAIYYGWDVWKWVSAPERKSRFYWLGWSCIGLTLYALSNIIFLGSESIFSYRIPELVEWLPHTFQSSARFFWPVFYLIIIVVIKTAAADRLKWRGRLCLALACLLQVYDLGLGIVAAQGGKLQMPEGQRYEDEFAGPQWDEAASGRKRVFFSGFENYYGIEYFGINHQLALSSFRFTRPSSNGREKEKQVWRRLEQGEYDRETLYLLTDKELELLGRINPATARRFRKIGRWNIL